MRDNALFTVWQPRLLSALRVMAALLLLQFGTAKLFGFPSVPYLQDVRLFSLYGAAGLIEIVGGTLLALGLFTRPVAFILSGEMAFAYFIEHAPQSFFPAVNDGTLAVLFCFVFLHIAAAGGGPWSADALRFIRRRGLPYDPLVPNQETIEAMEAARRGDLATVASVDDLLADLKADDRPRLR